MADSMNEAAPQRIAKLLARAGLCSRRDAERWIAEGRVAVNGEVLTSPALVVGDADEVRVDGKPLPEPERARLWRYHKPAGLVTTHRDEKGRRTVFAALPKELPRLVSIGRLDLNAEGLLLLTNDGALARRLELPATGWLRRYRVRVHGIVETARLAALAKGITIDEFDYGPIHAQLDRQQGSNAWLTLSLREGKNREVRRVLEHLGYPVTRLIRLSYGPFQLGHLDRGAVEEVPKKVLEEQLGKGDRPPRPHARRRR
jgi:23S rRNA pseudouridine2605 synthase